VTKCPTYSTTWLVVACQSRPPKRRLDNQPPLRLKSFGPLDSSRFKNRNTNHFIMGIAKKTRKFGAVKRMIGQRDARLQKNKDSGEIKKETGKEIVRAIPQVSSALFFQYNTSLVPPYSVLVDVSHLISIDLCWCLG